MYTLKNQPGFTIVELLIVVVVIAILATISAVAYTNIQNRANDSVVQSDLNSFAKQLQLTAVEKGRYPAGGATRSGGSDVGDSTSFPSFKFQPSKSAYYTAETNLYYCTGTETASNQSFFRIRARSKSGNTFEYISSGGIQNRGNVSVGGVLTVCRDLDDPKTWAYGYYSITNTWYSWTN